ncbi:MAG: lysophospholipid acyltransferase family protein [Flammeovirgaceae bacterium]|nr:MAG: lysophospholipid acyltransferase family protein [Flammeovirgaceae bacterium]
MFFLTLLSRLPFPILYGISDCLYFVSYYLVRYRRNLVNKNLRNAFPDKSVAERKVIAKQFYRNLCDYVVETLKLLTIKENDLKIRMHYTNPELLSVYTSQNQSVILLSSHQFNWEWLLAAGTLWLNAPIDFVYQPIQTRFTDYLMLRCRTRFGGYPIKRNEVARELAKRKNIVRGIAIVADQYPGRSQDKKYEALFLNQKTVFFTGSQQMATLTQYPVLYGAVKQLKRGYYACTLVKIAEPPYNAGSEIVLQNYIKEVEHVINENPAGWLWSHNRWKTRHLKRASGQYPRASAAS